MNVTVSDHVKHTIGRALGRVPSGVFILTASHEGHPLAMMASWVQQAAFQPPCVSVAVAKGRTVGDALTPGAVFALCVVPEGDKSLMKKYARGIAPGADPFDGVSTRRTERGAVILSDALAYLECRVEMRVDLGADHNVVIAEVTAGELLKDGASFMHLRGSGFHY